MFVSSRPRRPPKHACPKTCTWSTRPEYAAQVCAWSARAESENSLYSDILLQSLDQGWVMYYFLMILPTQRYMPWPVCFGGARCILGRALYARLRKRLAYGRECIIQAGYGSLQSLQIPIIQYKPVVSVDNQ